MATRTELAHLLRRATFGPRADELDAAERAGYDATLSALLAPADPVSPPHFDTDPLVDLPKNADRPTRLAAQQDLNDQIRQITVWWLDRMVSADRQFAEK